MPDIIYEIIWVIAWMSAAIPSIPQIIQTIKTKNVKWLSTWMFRILGIWWVCWIIYWTYLNSRQMQLFNSISLLCSITMIILIKVYSKRETKNKKKSMK